MLLCLAAGACSFVPATHRPEVATAPAWDSPVPSGGRPSTVRDNWWRHFDSPALDRLENDSLAASFTLQAAVARIHEAEGAAWIAAAPLAPALDIAGTTNASTRSGNSGTNGQLVAQASYELDFWGRNRAAASSSAALARASAYDAGTVAMTLSASVANGYFTILSLRERVRLAHQQADDSRQILQLIRVQRGAGAATDLELRQQETAVASFDAAVLALEQQLAAATHALAVLSGRAPEGFTVADAALADIGHPPISPDLPPQLLGLRPDVEAAEARLASANFDVGVARAAFFPTLSLSASGGLASATTTAPQLALANVGASLLAPLFEGGQLKGQLTQAEARKVELVATYRQTVLTAYQDVEDALSAIDLLGRQEAVEAGAARSAQQAAELARTQYRAGSADYLSVLTTEQIAYQTRDTLAQLRLQHLEAIVSLCRALGGGFGRADLASISPPPAVASGAKPSGTSQ
ncbi:efflux transporter outer membrane subunit [Sphingomonas nostoxanthinifaciens]|uniref:efflux transporter outer membrane subunit n=1 Tax=Sphingomonas nostoxanthinifaciens TaxID=2872652 RepID=UPI001CC1EE75|nr:efflux transporter outer membrane subunit [Sphingomonas nostoxanthinifaciens]